MSRKANLSAGKDANKHVEEVVWAGAANRFGDNLWPPLFGAIGTEASWAWAGVSSFWNPIDPQDRMAVIERMAELGRTFRSGNCDPQASVAFLYLRDRGIRPLDYMMVGDHAFVVIGRLQNSNPANPSSWGPDAVVVDPWDRQVYPAEYFASRMYMGWKKVGTLRAVGLVDEVPMGYKKVRHALRIR